MNKEEQIKAVEIISKMCPDHLKLLAEVMDNPKRAMQALDLMISNSKDHESNLRLLSLKHSIESYMLEESKGD